MLCNVCARGCVPAVFCVVCWFYSALFVGSATCHVLVDWCVVCSLCSCFELIVLCTHWVVFYMLMTVKTASWAG